MLSLKEASAILGVPYSSVVYYLREGSLPVIRISGRNLIAPETLRQALIDLGYRKRRVRTA